MDTAPDETMSEAASARVSALSPADLHSIDHVLLTNCSAQWRKVARIVGTSMIDGEIARLGLPDVFLADRIFAMADAGRLELNGQRGYMRFSEVRLPSVSR